MSVNASRRVRPNQLRGLFGLRLGQVTTPGKLRERLEVLFARKPELKPIPGVDPIVARRVRFSALSKLHSPVSAAGDVRPRGRGVVNQFTL